jgi:hypothetical protein
MKKKMMKIKKGKGIKEVINMQNNKLINDLDPKDLRLSISKKKMLIMKINQKM